MGIVKVFEAAQGLVKRMGKAPAHFARYALQLNRLFITHCGAEGGEVGFGGGGGDGWVG